MDIDELSDEEMGTGQGQNFEMTQSLINQLAQTQTLQKFTNGEEAAVRNVLVKAFKEIQGLRNMSNGQDKPSLVLQFSHECLHIACASGKPQCELCKNAHRRRCETNFSEKYLQNDTLKAFCGAAIRLDILRADMTTRVPFEEVSNVKLELFLVDTKEYQRLLEMHLEDSDVELDKIRVVHPDANKALLTAGPRGASMDGISGGARRVYVPLMRNGKTSGASTCLPDITIDGSSEAILTGLKPTFSLIARAVDVNTNRRVPGIRCTASEPFVVATQRVKGACKVAIPLTSTDVRKLKGVGVQTAKKMQDIAKAAHETGLVTKELETFLKNAAAQGFSINCIATVGDFRRLVDLLETDKEMCEQVKKILKLTRGWDEAREHARMAVALDNNLRVYWFGENQQEGLLFNGYEGSIKLDASAGYITRSVSPSGRDRYEYQEFADLTTDDQQWLERMRAKAIADWFTNGHPQWDLFGNLDLEAFLKLPNVTVRRGSLPVPKDRFDGIAPRLPDNHFHFPNLVMDRQFTARLGDGYMMDDTAMPGPSFAPALVVQSRGPTRIDVSDQPVRESYDPPPGSQLRFPQSNGRPTDCLSAVPIRFHDRCDQDTKVGLSSLDVGPLFLGAAGLSGVGQQPRLGGASFQFTAHPQHAQRDHVVQPRHYAREPVATHQQYPREPVAQPPQYAREPVAQPQQYSRDPMAHSQHFFQEPVGQPQHFSPRDQQHLQQHQMLSRGTMQQSDVQDVMRLPNNVQAVLVRHVIGKQGKPPIESPFADPDQQNVEDAPGPSNPRVRARDCEDEEDEQRHVKKPTLQQRLSQYLQKVIDDDTINNLRPDFRQKLEQLFDEQHPNGFPDLTVQSLGMASETLMPNLVFSNQHSFGTRFSQIFQEYAEDPLISGLFNPTGSGGAGGGSLNLANFSGKYGEILTRDSGHQIQANRSGLDSLADMELALGIGPGPDVFNNPSR